jgi:hypothetical protein
MSAIRDADALVATMKSLSARYHDVISPAIRGKATSALKAQRKQAYARLAGRSLANARQILVKTRRRIRSRVRDATTGRSMRVGVTHGYRRARRAMADAIAAGADDARFHAWRRSPRVGARPAPRATTGLAWRRSQPRRAARGDAGGASSIRRRARGRRDSWLHRQTPGRAPAALRPPGTPVVCQKAFVVSKRDRERVGLSGRDAAGVPAASRPRRSCRDGYSAAPAWRASALIVDSASFESFASAAFSSSSFALSSARASFRPRSLAQAINEPYAVIS